MKVSATEFKSNIGRFLQLSQKEDVFILKNGKMISKLTKAKDDDKEQKLNALNDISGFLEHAPPLDVDELKKDRILNK